MLVWSFWGKVGLLTELLEIATSNQLFQFKKLSQILSVKENKPPIVNTQCVVYLFQCDLCDANYVGFTARHLHQRISGHPFFFFFFF